MNTIVKEWLVKAEAGHNSALREYRARKNPNFDATGFHAQQSIEKYLKAILQYQKTPFQKIHDLLALMELCSPTFPQLVAHKNSLAYLNQFAVLFPYPGESADKEAAKKAIATLKVLRKEVRTYLKLDHE